MGRRPVLAAIVLTAVAAARAWSWPAMVGPALAPAVDGSGDVIVPGVGGVLELAGSGGATVWHATITAPHGFTVIHAVDTDTTGDVAVAGALDSDFAVVKLSGTTGAELWRYTLAGTDDARAVAVDANGDVVAAGRVQNAATGADWVVVKLAAGDGSELWRTTIDGGGADFDEPAALAVDASGNVATVGVLIDATAQWRFGVVKLAGADGAELWRSLPDPAFRGFNGTGFVYSGGKRVATDGTGNVIAAGSSRTAASSWWSSPRRAERRCGG